MIKLTSSNYNKIAKSKNNIKNIINQKVFLVELNLEEAIDH